METEIKEDLENKINEIYLKYQDRFDIQSGDIYPEQLFRQDELLDALAKLISEVLECEMK